MVEKVTETVEKYKSKDGNLYDTLEKAEKADKEWERKNSFDPAKEVALLEKLCGNNFSRLQKRIDAGKTQFPSFWMTETKYGEDYYMCNSFNDMEEMGWKAFQMWYNYYMCGDDETVAVAKLIKETENKKAALEFVLDRCSRGYEYEKMEKIYMTTFNKKEENNV